MWAWPGHPGAPHQSPMGLPPQAMLYAYPGMQPPPFPPYPYYAPLMPPTVPMQSAGKEMAGGKTKRRRKNKQAKAEGAPKKPATSFVMFSNAHREEVKAAHPGLSFIDVGKKLGEMWREMDPAVRKEWEDRATAAKDEYLEAKKMWLENRSVQSGLYGD